MTADGRDPASRRPVPPVERTVTVPLDPDTAFKLFTEEIDAWWPATTHSLSAERGEVPRRIEVEPRVGGRIVETMPDGTRASWGRITRWEPGRALGVAWHLGGDEATDLLVVFSPIGEGTRVDLTHGGFDRLGDAATAMASSYRTGWDKVLCACFAGHCRACHRVTA